MKNLALFDFDGNISHKDTFWDFIKYTVNPIDFAFSHLALSYTYLRFHAGILSNGQAKQRIMNHHFKGWKLERFNDAAEHYALNRIDDLLIDKAMDAIKYHQDNGDHIVVVSGSFENWLSPWCAQHGICTIGSKLEVRNNHLTGKLDGHDCIGPEKVSRIKSYINPEQYKKIYAYGDSEGDREMLNMADVKYFKWNIIE